MIAKLKPYPTYKDSRVEWLGEVPEHWEVVPLCAIAKPKSITNQHGRELLSVYLNRGVIRFSDVKEKRTNVTSEDLSRYQAVDPGDFILNNQQAWRGSVGVSSYSGIVSPAYLVLSLGLRINPEFANLLFRGRTMVAQYLIASRGVGSIQRNLYWPSLKRVPTLIPPLPEQTVIVHFLDHKCKSIDHQISQTHRAVKLMLEYRTRLIADVVTGKIDVHDAASRLPIKEKTVEKIEDSEDVEEPNG